MDRDLVYFISYCVDELQEGLRGRISLGRIVGANCNSPVQRGFLSFYKFDSLEANGD